MNINKTDCRPKTEDLRPKKSAVHQFIWSLSLGFLCLTMLTGKAWANDVIQVSCSGNGGGDYILVASTKSEASSEYLTVDFVNKGIISADAHTFSTLPTPNTYYIYAFEDDVAADGVWQSSETAGGYGPFNGKIAECEVYLDGTAGTTNITNLVLGGRVIVSGTVANNSSQTGQRIVVEAVPSNGDSSYSYTTVLDIVGGSFTLGGLKEIAGGSYTLKAYVDMQTSAETGWMFWDYFEDGTAPATTHDAGTTPAEHAAGEIVIADGGNEGAAPDHIRMTDDFGNTYQTILADAQSSELKVSVHDINGVETSTPTDVTVTFSAHNYTTNSSVTSAIELSTDAWTTTFDPGTGIVISGDSTASPKFRFRTSEIGDIGFHAQASNFPAAGDSRWAYSGFQVLPATADFSNVRIRTDSQSAYASGVTSVTITPNHDGTDDTAVIACSPPVNGYWEVLISTDPTFAGDLVYHRGNWGQDESWWYGQNEFDNHQRVPTGTYYVRLQTQGGGITNDTLSINVVSAYISGTVAVDETPEADVDVYVHGRQGGGHDRTGEDGTFYIGGLTPGQKYTVEFNKEGLTSTRQESVSANTDIGTIEMQQGAMLAVHASISDGRTVPYDLFGHVNANTLDHTHWAWGNIHISSGSEESDNHQWGNDLSTWTILSVKPNTQYRVNVNLPEFGEEQQTVTSPASGETTYMTVFSFERKANVSGGVSFPSEVDTPYNGEWVSVDVFPSGSHNPVAWGGVYLPNGTSSGTYTVAGLDAGTYDFRTHVRGYKSAQIQVTVAAKTDQTGVDFPEFTEGGQISGTLSLVGDSSQLESNNYWGHSNCNSGVPVHINAWSPSTYMHSGTEVCVSTDPVSTSSTYSIRGLDDAVYEVHSFVSGFQMDPPGRKLATISGGTGSLDLTFKKLTGGVDLSVTLPGGTDPTTVSYRLEGAGPDEGSSQGTLDASAQASITGLGTGLYAALLTNHTTGLQKKAAVSVTNGQTSTLQVDMTDTVYSISGSVSIQGSIVLKSTSTNENITISSAIALRAYAPPAPFVKVFSFPLPDHFHGSVQPYKMGPADVHVTSATFDFSGFIPGTYLVRVEEDLNPGEPDEHCPDCVVLGVPEMGTTNEIVFINDASVSDVALTLRNGAKISGTISRPSGDTSTDIRLFKLELHRTDGFVVWGTSVTTTGQGTAAYQFPHVSAGDYVLELVEENQSPKYTADPVRITVGTSNKTQNITLVKAGVIVGKLRDADSGTLITSRNVAQLLPDNFSINADANPWVPGGYAWADWEGPRPKISTSTHQFSIPRVKPGTTYDVRIRQYSDMSRQAIAQGQKSYAPVVVSGINVSPGQTVDVGTIDLYQGVTMSGNVTDSAGTPLPNVMVVGFPAVGNGGDRWDLQVEAFTDENGNYTLVGVDRNQRYFDVMASPRFSGGSIFHELAGKKYATSVKKMIDVTDEDARAGIDFQLTEANAVLTGRVTTSDGGALQNPFGDGDFKQRSAMIFLHEEGTDYTDNPLGEIEEITDARGYFSIKALKPGSYVLRAISVGYATALKRLVITAGANSAGTVTIEKGATISGTITKPDGSNPSTNEMEFIVGVDQDFEEFVFGNVDADDSSQLITGYSLTGFKPGLNYAVLMGTENDDIIEGKSDLTFTSSTETKTVNLIYRPSPPSVYVTATYDTSTNLYTLRFFTTQRLRNLTDADNDFTATSTIMTLAEGNGTIVSRSLSPSRDFLTATYRAPANEATFSIRIAFTSVTENPDTGANFTFDQTFPFRAGVVRSRVVKISNAIGGSCQLEGDPTGSAFVSGAFDVESSSTVEVGIYQATGLSSLGVQTSQKITPVQRAQALYDTAQRLGPAAYSPGLYAAIQKAPSVSPFSSFYEVFLPAGVSRSLKNEALLTLNYDASVTDPSEINVYYFDELNDVYLLEDSQRSVDTVNRTITVGVRHLSTFVVLSSNAPIIGSNNYTGTEIFVHNFPNPFNLKTKTVTLENTTPASTQSIEGTMIKYGLPAGKTGTVKFEIYNVVGELVRTITETASTGGTYYYTEWNGRNDGGTKVSSGVYMARFTLNGGEEKFFKMAVVK